MSAKSLASGLPKSLKIGPYPWDIKFAEGWIKVEDSKKWGVCDFSQATITISDPEIFPNKEMFIGTVIHEVIHAMWSVGNLGSKAKEEDAVMALETGFLALFKDNPKFIVWVQKGLK